MLDGMTELRGRAEKGINHNQIQLSAQLYFAAANFGPYKPGQEPHLRHRDRAELLRHARTRRCRSRSPANFRCVNDGAPLTHDPVRWRPRRSAFDQQAIGSPAETALVDTLVAGTCGTTPDKVRRWRRCSSRRSCAERGDGSNERDLLSPLIKLSCSSS